MKAMLHLEKIYLVQRHNHVMWENGGKRWPKMKDRNHFVLKVKPKGKKLGEFKKEHIQIQRTNVGTCWVEFRRLRWKKDGKKTNINDTNETQDENERKNNSENCVWKKMPNPQFPNWIKNQNIFFTFIDKLPQFIIIFLLHLK